VAVSPVNGDIIVTDFERHTVVFFDKYGRFLTQYNGDNEETTGSQQATDVSTNAQRRLKVN
jgi:NHL repeat